MDFTLGDLAGQQRSGALTLGDLVSALMSPMRPQRRAPPMSDPLGELAARRLAPGGFRGNLVDPSMVINPGLSATGQGGDLQMEYEPGMIPLGSGGIRNPYDTFELWGWRS